MKRNTSIRWLLTAIIAFVVGLPIYMLMSVVPRSDRLNTTLIQATYNGQEPKALDLLKQGADANLRLDSQTRKSLPSGFWQRMRAHLRGEKPEAPAQIVPLISLAAAYSRKMLLTELLARGVNVDASDGLGSTPLMYAVDHNDRDIIIDLLNAGADANHQNLAGNTALHLAVAQRNGVNMTLLLDHDANPNVANAQRQTPLDDLAALAADVHRKWLTAYIDALAQRAQKHSAPVASPPGSLVLPSQFTPELVTRQHQALLGRLSPLVSLLRKHGAVTSEATKTLLADSFLLDPQEATQGIAPPSHHR